MIPLSLIGVVGGGGSSLSDDILFFLHLLVSWHLFGELFICSYVTAIFCFYNTTEKVSMYQSGFNIERFKISKLFENEGIYLVGYLMCLFCTLKEFFYWIVTEIIFKEILSW